jgi:hypothetical protein
MVVAILVRHNGSIILIHLAFVILFILLMPYLSIYKPFHSPFCYHAGVTLANDAVIALAASLSSYD